MHNEKEENFTLIGQSAKRGFTLIELSIVLVIIGLLVGGVLYGSDLIHAAEIRATISQLEGFDTAAMTFRIKYNGMPGDLAEADTKFGFDATGQGSTTGNGTIDRSDNTDEALVDEESALFFRHLAQAEMIGQNITVSDGTTANVDSLSATLPAARMGRGNFVAVMNINSRNYMFIVGVSGITDGVATFADSMTPIEAYSFDTKLDDGVPTTGTVIAVTDFVTANTDDSGGGAAAGECVNGTNYYTSSTVTANVAGCMLRRRPSF